MLQRVGGSALLASRTGRVPRDWQGLQRLLDVSVASGAKSIVCDVCEAAQLASAVYRWPVQHVLHAAGVSTTQSLTDVGVRELSMAFGARGGVPT